VVHVVVEKMVEGKGSMLGEEKKVPDMSWAASREEAHSSQEEASNSRTWPEKRRKKREEHGGSSEIQRIARKK